MSQGSFNVPTTPFGPRLVPPVDPFSGRRPEDDPVSGMSKATVPGYGECRIGVDMAKEPSREVVVVTEHPSWVLALGDGDPGRGLRFALALLLNRLPDKKATFTQKEIWELLDSRVMSKSITTYENPATGSVDVVLT